MTVKELRQSGNKVRVIHKRKYKFFDLIKKEFIYHIFSKFEFVNFLKIGKIPRYLVVNRLQTGGQTVIEITMKDGLELRGVAKVNDCDNYNKKLGIKLALNRALNNLKYL